MQNRRPIRAFAHQPTRREFRRILAGREFALSVDEYPHGQAATSHMYHLRPLYGKKRQATKAQLTTWVTHPSEYVQVRAVTLFQRQLLKLPELHTASLRQALRDAAAEGALWTPLLDAFAASGLWQEAAGSLSEAEQSPGEPDERVASLVAEIQQMDKTGLQQITGHLHYRPLMEAVARHGLAFNESAVGALTRGHGMAGVLVRNNRLEPHLLRNVFNPLNLALDPEPQDKRLIAELLDVLDSLARERHPAFDAALGAAAGEAPESVAEWIRSGRISHPDRPARDLLIALLTQDEEEARLLGLRALSSMTETARPARRGRR